jgi:hypothetical protein
VVTIQTMIELMGWASCRVRGEAHERKSLELRDLACRTTGQVRVARAIVALPRRRV